MRTIRCGGTSPTKPHRQRRARRRSTRRAEPSPTRPPPGPFPRDDGRIGVHDLTDPPAFVGGQQALERDHADQGLSVEHRHVAGVVEALPGHRGPHCTHRVVRTGERDPAGRGNRGDPGVGSSGHSRMISERPDGAGESPRGDDDVGRPPRDLGCQPAATVREAPRMRFSSGCPTSRGRTSTGHWAPSTSRRETPPNSTLRSARSRGSRRRAGHTLLCGFPARSTRRLPDAGRSSRT